MAILEAPISKFKQHNALIFMAVLIGLGTFFTYDGFCSKNPNSFRHEWYLKHAPEGVENSTIKSNKYMGPPMVIVGILSLGYFFYLKNRKLTANEEGLDVEGKQKVKYSQIESIDKTNFKSKGYFVIVYKEGETEKNLKISDRRYDGLDKILDMVIEKIS